ncbi:PREDICTED: pentatricopeptide repeat-containing protein At1g03100, mitochondrial [Nicotiana attenuata]|uniref:Pentatricopeptide repeat-containing protein, mitochondrial n=1 Tax=Nicotiana attenuata TaxID=49451 RepID=A0A1J6ILE8_NICAT|nr:PREDICTED: pentatricopeptide repeat-containing protein At1g03100, mitochondrial [Nicotiana attenuata]XP_019266402.1 PREDICTED: pentatricopeptide repeat-containing protein At1g03100, mitochondrial [Nicotiana attenuata]XP_019266411.1 PREDICTED: pentatricopeptide repeat-containing protein At1g03100, mitochondrial [Nicotiana attenuata]XP_019266417.1 PREDICTED: pentatricopeptide repeat-containing protein At1g03100, mitochondrial [Nicotiana attenuata]XP_019266420.1 PREDICTED: pentatricopeptide rep
MIALRKLNLGMAACPFSLLRLIAVNGHYVVFKHTIQSGWSSEFVNRLGSFSRGNIEIQSGVDCTAFAQTAPFSTIAGTILVHAQDLGKMSEELENVIDEDKLDDAWFLYERHIQMAGFPRKSIVNKLVAAFAESSDLRRLEKAYALVEQAFEENKHDLLGRNALIHLSLALAKCGLPIPASTLVRKLVETEQFPPVSAWSAILAYMSQTSNGAYLGVELILEIGYLFQDGRVDPRKKSNEPLLSMKPNTTCFNIALAGCLLFGTTRKAEQLLDMMPRINLKADPTLLIIMAHIYEKNGRREELKKLKRDMEEAPNVTDMQFRQFYNCLLSCYLKFGDLESASHMVLEMLRKAEKAKNSLGVANLLVEASRSGNASLANVPLDDAFDRNSDGSENLVLYEDLCRDRKFLKLQIIAKNLLDVLVIKLQKQIEFITSERGILQPTEKLYVKLVKAFLEAGRTKDLAEFLIKAEKEDSPVSVDDSSLVHVINSCISLGWLDQAHDLLDEMRLAGVRTGSSVYSSLLKAYCKENRAGEVASLLRDARKAGVQVDASCYEVLIQSRALQKDAQGALDLFKEMKESKIPRKGHQEFENLVKGSAEGGEASLVMMLLHEIKEGQKVDYGVHDWNNVIHFFCKKRLLQDAEKAFKKMRSLGHAPNAQTFHSLVTGYAAIGGKYVEVTELWGEMKSLAFSSGMKFDQELLDAVLYTFVRGGFFVRANEVVEMMEKGNMFIDKYKYRTLFLKYHKTLYKGKAPKFQSETQMKKREAALNFKRWAGLC